MRPGAIALCLVALAAPARGADDGAVKPRVDAIVPIPPTEHERLYWFGRRDHHLVPGTVTIDHRLHLDGKAFRDEDQFVAHLRTKHHVTPARIPDRLLILDGRVHFVAQ